MEPIIIIGLVAAFLFIGVMMVASESSDKTTALQNSFRQRNPSGDLIAAAATRTFVNFNDVTQEVTFCANGGTHDEKFSYADIGKVDLIENGSTKTTTSKSGIGRAVVGGVLAGPAGMVVGAVTGSSTGLSNAMVTKLAVRIYVLGSVKEVVFWEDSTGSQSSSNSLMQHLNAQCLQCHAKFVEAMRMAERASVQPMREVPPEGGASQITVPASSDVASRIKDLWDLHQVGALTAEEFQSEKTKALSG